MSKSELSGSGHAQLALFPARSTRNLTESSTPRAAALDTEKKRFTPSSAHPSTLLSSSQAPLVQVAEVVKHRGGEERAEARPDAQFSPIFSSTDGKGVLAVFSWLPKEMKHPWNPSARA